MGPGYYILAILGCADGSTQCTPVATVPARYESEAACAAATADALAARSDMDFPTLVAECRAVTRPAAASEQRPRKMPSGAARG